MQCIQVKANFCFYSVIRRRGQNCLERNFSAKEQQQEHKPQLSELHLKLLRAQRAIKMCQLKKLARQKPPHYDFAKCAIYNSGLPSSFPPTARVHYTTTSTTAVQ